MVINNINATRISTATSVTGVTNNRSVVNNTTEILQKRKIDEDAVGLSISISGKARSLSVQSKLNQKETKVEDISKDKSYWNTEVPDTISKREKLEPVTISDEIKYADYSKYFIMDAIPADKVEHTENKIKSQPIETMSPIDMVTAKDTVRNLKSMPLNERTSLEMYSSQANSLHADVLSLL